MFQASMDLPADKAKLLKQYDNEKKWDIICDEVRDFILFSSLKYQARPTIKKLTLKI